MFLFVFFFGMKLTRCRGTCLKTQRRLLYIIINESVQILKIKKAVRTAFGAKLNIYLLYGYFFLKKVKKITLLMT